MRSRLYLEELAQVRNLAGEFAEAHPALAPLLGESSCDPDVERLLQGVAFQFALLREKIEDDFPEFIHSLARLICPQFLRPVPATTMVAFSPKASATSCQTVGRGSQLASVPVDGTRCLFQTCADVEVHPLELIDASLVHPPGEPAAISLSLALNNIPLNQWAPRSVRFFLAGDYTAAADLYLLLLRHLKQIVITPEREGRSAVLPADFLKPAGFSEQEAVIPYPPNVHPGYRLLQEFFALPQRFLFLDLLGWEHWTDRGNGSRFTVRFELSSSPLTPPRVRRDQFVLFAAPAVNLFSADADPFILDHRKERYLLRPEGLPPGHAQVFSVDRVIGFKQGRCGERTYHPNEHFRPITATEPAYGTAVTSRPAGQGFDVHLSFFHPEEGMLERETICADLTCTNGRLAERLRIGDLCEATGSSPQSIAFQNILPVAPSMMPPLGKNLLWRLVSHQALNLRSVVSAEGIRELLQLYLFEDGGRHHTFLAANRKRIEGIEEMVSRPVDRLVRGVPVRGAEITIRINCDNFAGAGDLFLFGSVLDRFLAGFASLNTFTQLTVEETARGGTFAWPPRLGEQPLL